MKKTLRSMSNRRSNGLCSHSHLKGFCSRMVGLHAIFQNGKKDDVPTRFGFCDGEPTAERLRLHKFVRQVTLVSTVNRMRKLSELKSRLVWNTIAPIYIGDLKSRHVDCGVILTSRADITAASSQWEGMVTAWPSG